MFGVIVDMIISSRNNAIASIISLIPDSELCGMIEEISEFRRTGALSDSTNKLRDVCLQVADACSSSYSDMMRATEDAVLFEAARRYHNQFC